LTRLRLVPFRQLSKVAEGAGFRWVRQEGSQQPSAMLKGVLW